jgi:polyferredoxin
MKRTLQRVIQLLFLALFVFLVFTGKPQLWMGLFILGVIASFLLGRVFCGWACSINTVLTGITWVKRKLHIQNIKIPDFMKKTWVRLLMMALFVAAFMAVMLTGRKLPVLPILFAGAVILTFFFPEELWHRYLCPYGTILNLPAAASKLKMTIDPQKCNNCGACLRTCPAKAVEKKETHHEISKRDCLICFACSEKCRQDAISYK